MTSFSRLNPSFIQRLIMQIPLWVRRVTYRNEKRQEEVGGRAGGPSRVQGAQLTQRQIPDCAAGRQPATSSHKLFSNIS